MRKLLPATNLLTSALFILWPLAVWLGLKNSSARGLAIVALAGIAVALILASGRRSLAAAKPLVPAIVLAGAAAASGDERFLLVLPVLMNLAVAFAFGVSLRPGSVPLVERFARKMGGPPPGGDVHCRQFTILWTVFGLLNAILAGWLALGQSVDRWAAWTGIGSYVCIGLLFGLERLMRYLRFERHP